MPCMRHVRCGELREQNNDEDEHRERTRAQFKQVCLVCPPKAHAPPSSSNAFEMCTSKLAMIAKGVLLTLDLSIATVRLTIVSLRQPIRTLLIIELVCQVIYKERGALSRTVIPVNRVAYWVVVGSEHVTSLDLNNVLARTEPHYPSSSSSSSSDSEHTTSDRLSTSEHATRARSCF